MDSVTAGERSSWPILPTEGKLRPSFVAGKPVGTSANGRFPPSEVEKLTFVLLPSSSFLFSFPSNFFTSFSPSHSCCVDALSALHISSDFLVHYGHACLTRSSDPALRLRYVFPSLPLSIPSTIDAIVSLASSSTEPEDRDRGVVVMYDVGYYWAVGELEEALKEKRRLEKGKGREIIFSRIELDEQEVPLGGGAKSIKIKKSENSSPPEVSLWPVSQEKPGESSTPTPTERPHTCTCDKPKGGPSCSGSVDLATTPTCSRVTSRAPSDSVPHPTSLPPSSSGVSHKTTSLRSYSLPSDKTISDYLIFYIGDGDSLQIRNILVTHSRNQVRPFLVRSPRRNSTDRFRDASFSSFAPGLLLHPLNLSLRPTTFSSPPILPNQPTSHASLRCDAEGSRCRRSGSARRERQPRFVFFPFLDATPRLSSHAYISSPSSLTQPTPSHSSLDSGLSFEKLTKRLTPSRSESSTQRSSPTSPRSNASFSSPAERTVW